MADIYIGGLAVSAIITGIIDAGRKIGLPVEFTPLASMTLGILISMGAWATGATPEISNWFVALLSGVTVGLLSCGLYSSQRVLSGSAK